MGMAIRQTRMMKVGRYHYNNLYKSTKVFGSRDSKKELARLNVMGER